MSDDTLSFETFDDFVSYFTGLLIEGDETTRRNRRLAARALAEALSRLEFDDRKARAVYENVTKDSRL